MVGVWSTLKRLARSSTVGEVDVDVLHAEALPRDGAEHSVRGAARRPDLGRELQECGLRAECCDADFLGADHVSAGLAAYSSVEREVDEPERGRARDEGAEHDRDREVHGRNDRQRNLRAAHCDRLLTAPIVKAMPEPVSTPAPIEFRSDVTVELVRSSAHDSDVLFAARVSTQGEKTLESAQDADLDASRSKGLINFLMRDFASGCASCRRR